MKVKIQKLSKQERIETLDSLYTAAGTVRGRDAMKRFLRDLLTSSERVMLGRRIMIARRLLAGVSHRNIATEMKVGGDTVWKIARWLDDQIPGYEDAVKGLEKETQKRCTAHRRSVSQHPLAILKRKYPLHFLLFPWPKDL